jgi:hypothetical protein
MKARGISIQRTEAAAHDCFIAQFRACNFALNVDKDIERYCKTFGRPIPQNISERRQALQAMACREVRRVKNTLTARKARQLIAEKYNGVVIGRVAGKDITLCLSQQSLYRIMKRKLPQTGPWPAPSPASAASATAEADAAFIAEYRARNFGLDVAKTLTQFREKYARAAIPIDWQETRIALLIAACVELDQVLLKLSGGKARKLIAAKYHGAALGVSKSIRREVTLRISPTSLWKYHKSGAHLPGGSPDVLRMALHRCGRKSQP